MATQRADLERLVRDLESLTPEERAHVLSCVGARGQPRAENVPLGDRMAAAGPWEGETLEELLEILREGRESGRGSAEPPDL